MSYKIVTTVNGEKMAVENPNDDPDVVKFFRCQCGSTDHSFVLTHYKFMFDEIRDDDLYIHISLQPKRLWDRVRIGFQYMFGISTGNYGHWTEIMVSHADAIKMREVLDGYIAVRTEKPAAPAQEE